jgi:hypothetical protein
VPDIITPQNGVSPFAAVGHSRFDRGGVMSEMGERTGMTAPDPGTDPFLPPPLDAEQLALLSRYGQERPTTAGQVLFREGDRAYDFIVVLSGAVSVVDHEAGAVRDLGALGPGRFVAELEHLDRRTGVRDRGGQRTRVGAGGPGGSVAGSDRAGSDAA